MVETATPPTAAVTATPTAEQPKEGTQIPNPVIEAKPPEKDQFAEKLELLSRRERAIYRERQKVAAERKEAMDAYAKVKAWEESKTNAKKNPIDYISQAGLSYDDLTAFMLNGGQPKPEDKIESIRGEFEAFKKQQEDEKLEAKKSAEESQQKEYAEAIESFQGEISEFISQNKSTYELISTREADEDVFTTIRDQFQLSMQDWVKKGRQGKPPMPMTVKEAADLVEEFYEKEVERLASTQKMQAKFQPTQKAQEPGQKKGPSPTLTNQMTTSAAASILPAKNEADRMARALAKLG